MEAILFTLENGGKILAMTINFVVMTHSQPCSLIYHHEVFVALGDYYSVLGVYGRSEQTY